MASLQEQLIKAGLVDERKAKKAAQEKQKQANQARRNKSRPQKPVNSAAQQRKAKQAERERLLNEKHQQQRKQKEIAAQVKQLIETNKLDRSKADISYRFVYKKKIKTIQVTEEQKKQLTSGQMVIATMVLPNLRAFEIVSPAIAQKIAERDETAVVTFEDDKKEADADDPYADYQIPDDLTW